MASSERLTRKESADQSRERLLHAGLELLAEQLHSPIDNIRSTDVARRAGYTAGAFYHHWPSQNDYRDELRSYVSGKEEIDTAVNRLGSDLAGDGQDDFVAALQQACRNELDHQVDDASWHVQLAMLASSDAADLARSEIQFRDWFDAYSALYEQLFAALKITLRPGFTMQWFTRTMSALSEGYALQQRSGLPRHDETHDRSEWQLYETAVAVLVTSATRRVDGRELDAGTVEGKLRDLVAD